MVETYRNQKGAVKDHSRMRWVVPETNVQRMVVCLKRDNQTVLCRLKAGRLMSAGRTDVPRAEQPLPLECWKIQNLSMADPSLVPRIRMIVGMIEHMALQPTETL